jgi:hypothetical protein
MQDYFQICFLDCHFAKFINKAKPRSNAAEQNFTKHNATSVFQKVPKFYFEKNLNNETHLPISHLNPTLSNCKAYLHVTGSICLTHARIHHKPLVAQPEQIIA